MVNKLHTEGRWIKDAYGRTVYLRGANGVGMTEGANGNWFNRNGTILFNTWNPAVIADNLDSMQDRGVNCYRILDTCRWWLEDTDGHRQKIKDLITMANERGIYIMYSFWHVTDSGVGADQLPYPPYSNLTSQLVITSVQDFVDMWSSIANELKGFPNIIFELWNEPEGAGVELTWFDVAQQAIAAIRAVTDHVIAVQVWDSIWVNLDNPTAPHRDMSWVQDPRLQGTNILYTTHIYNVMAHYPETPPAPPTWFAYSYQDLKSALTYCQVKEASETWDKPVLIGEIGCWTDENRITRFQNTLAILNEWNLGYLGWWWWPTGIYKLLELAPNYQLTDSGQVLIQKIAEGAPTPISSIIGIEGPITFSILALILGSL